jgi:hypothetical protein
MQLPSSVNPAVAVSKDSTRYPLTQVAITNGFAVSTDGRRLFVCEVDSENSETITEGMLQPEAVKHALKNKFNTGHFQFIERVDTEMSKMVDATVSTIGSTTTIYHGKVALKDFPKWLNVVPDHFVQPKKISINAKLLAELAAGLGDNVVTLEFETEPGKDEVVIVTANDPTVKAFALLMPCRDNSGCNPTLDKARSLKKSNQPQS